MLGACILATIFKASKLMESIPPSFTSALSDVAVPLAVLMMMVVDILFATIYPHAVPFEFSTQIARRRNEWFVTAYSNNPYFSIFLAIIPALFGAITIFLYQTITTTLVTRKEFNLKVRA